MSYLIENLAQLIFGAEPRPFPNVINNVPIISGELNLGFLTLLTIVSSAIILYITRTIVFKTKTGKAMRAVSEDLLAARLMGVNVNKTIK